jgi:amino-acid N-acetyltransferase
MIRAAVFVSRAIGYNRRVAFHCEPARPHDLGRALELLRAERLPEHGVVEQFGHYLVVRELGQLVGVCGVEVHGEYGLLRSLVIDPGFRGQGAGDCLVRGLLDFAGPKLHLKALYLLTTTAQRYFERYGFHLVTREEAPAAIRESWELREGCPASAAFMKRSL